MREPVPFFKRLLLFLQHSGYLLVLLNSATSLDALVDGTLTLKYFLWMNLVMAALLVPYALLFAIISFKMKMYQRIDWSLGYFLPFIFVSVMFFIIALGSDELDFLVSAMFIDAILVVPYLLLLKRHYHRRMAEREAAEVNSIAATP